MTNKEASTAPDKLEPNPVIVQLKKELAEARENELTAQGLKLKSSVFLWQGQQCGLRRAIKIVEGMSR